MKRILRSFAAVCIVAMSLTACTKEAKESTENVVSNDALSKIQSLGFGTQGVKKISEGYLVEGDIILTDAELNSRPTSPNLLIAQEEQYHTFNLVSVTKHPTIKVALSNSSAPHEAAFSAALD